MNCVFTLDKDISILAFNLDAEGKTSVTLKVPTATEAPGMLNATFTTRVFEPGGDASIYTQTIPFSPFTSYVGINLNQPKGKYIETDKDHVFDIVTVNTQGQLVNRTNLEYKIYRIGWSWWWENSGESFGTYINNGSSSGMSALFVFYVNQISSPRRIIDAELEGCFPASCANSQRPAYPYVRCCSSICH